MRPDWLAAGSKRGLPWLAVVLMFAVSRPSAAQTVPFPAFTQAVVDTRTPSTSLVALTARVNPGDMVSVRLMSGEDIVGTFSRASGSSLTMEVAGQAREIPARDVQQVVKRRGRTLLKRGLLIGAPIGAYVGSGACYQVDKSKYSSAPPPPSCGSAILTGTAIGAGIGAALGAIGSRPALVYSAPAHPSTGTGAVAVAPIAITSLAGLSARGVKPFDTIYVRKVGGEEVEGTFYRASEASLTLEIDGQPRAIAAADVQQVRRRGGLRVWRHIGRGFLIGASVGAIVLATAGSVSDSKEWPLGPRMFVGALGGGVVGIEVGAIVGAFVHDRPVVYRATAATVRVMPVLARGRAGVFASIQF